MINNLETYIASYCSGHYIVNYAIMNYFIQYEYSCLGVSKSIPTKNALHNGIYTIYQSIIQRIYSFFAKIRNLCYRTAKISSPDMEYILLHVFCHFLMIAISSFNIYSFICTECLVWPIYFASIEGGIAPAVVEVMEIM